MRYITADYIFPVSSPPIANGIVIVNDEGIIEDVINPKSEIRNQETEIYNGIICPGFINSHCHLELSYLKGMLSEGKGLPQFIREIVKNRSATPEEIEQAIVNAEDEMITNGIVGIGDICNTNHSFAQKVKGKLHYHNFIELFDLDANNAEITFNKGLALAKELTGTQSKIQNSKSKISLTPHAPYTVSSKLLKLIKEYADANNSPLSIHNEETSSENEMFISGKGELLDTMKSMVPVYNNWKPTGFGSLTYILAHLNTQNKTLLVHNTYITKEDIDFLNQSTINNQQFFFCFCPNANLFIEKQVPDFQLFVDNACKITIGTDSYASNWSLSILDELKTIQHHAPGTSLASLLQWATLNGAEFFGWNKELGSIEKGKGPGLNLIDNVDLLKMKLTSESGVKKIA